MNPSTEDNLQERICRLLDGELPRAEADSLDAELRACPRARSLYLQLAALHSALECQFSSRSENHPGRIIPIDLFLSRQRRRTVRIALLTAAAVLALAAIPLWMNIAKNREVLASFQITTDATFQLSHTEHFSQTAGQILHPGSRLKLESGRLEAKFPSGVRCVIEAPCELLAVGDDHVRIRRGLAWFHVPPEGHGFMVETRTLRIIDLGTEFGVLASRDGGDEIHVIKGSVEASALVSGKPGKPQILKSGHARRINEAGQLIKTALRASAFPTRLNEPLAIRNADFDAPPVDGAVYDKRGYGPIFAWGSSGAGVGFSDVSQPFLNNQPAHSGTRVAFIQGEGAIAQSVSGFDPTKTYKVTYFVNERGFSPDGISQPTTRNSVSLDLGESFYEYPGLITKTDAFRRIVSGPLHVFGPTANIEIRGQAASGDASLLIDSVSISRAVPAIPDGGFENPPLPPSTFRQASGAGGGTLGGAAWSFSNEGGITTNGSDFQPATAPEGSQAAILQNNAAIETTIHGFEPGVTYSLSLEAAGRKGGTAPFQVLLDGKTLVFNGSDHIAPPSLSYQTFTSEEFSVSRTSQRLRISSTGEGTTFLDDLRFNFVAEASENPPGTAADND
jgi:hypothetical protein